MRIVRREAGYRPPGDTLPENIRMPFGQVVSTNESSVSLECGDGLGLLYLTRAKCFLWNSRSADSRQIPSDEDNRQRKWTTRRQGDQVDGHRAVLLIRQCCG